MGSVFQLKFKDYKIGEETDSSRCRLKKSCLKCKDNKRLKVIGSRKIHFEKQSKRFLSLWISIGLMAEGVSGDRGPFHNGSGEKLQ